MTTTQQAPRRGRLASASFVVAVLALLVGCLGVFLALRADTQNAARDLGAARDECTRALVAARANAAATLYVERGTDEAAAAARSALGDPATIATYCFQPHVIDADSDMAESFWAAADSMSVFMFFDTEKSTEEIMTPSGRTADDLAAEMYDRVLVGMLDHVKALPDQGPWPWSEIEDPPAPFIDLAPPE